MFLWSNRDRKDIRDFDRSAQRRGNDQEEVDRLRENPDASAIPSNFAETTRTTLMDGLLSVRGVGWEMAVSWQGVDFCAYAFLRVLKNLSGNEEYLIYIRIIFSGLRSKSNISG